MPIVDMRGREREFSLGEQGFALTAFEDLTSPDSAPPRASLEIRMFAFYED